MQTAKKEMQNDDVSARERIDANLNKGIAYENEAEEGEIKQKASIDLRAMGKFVKQSKP